jgi:predicted dehydrogenase
VKTWKIAIVGAGYMAAEHAKAFAALPDVIVAGICSRTRARAEALASTCGARVFDSIAEMHRETRADAIIVAVNELSMRAVCEACFAYPWAVLMEKPVGVDLADAEQILAAARKAGTRAFVALNRRCYAATRQALAELADDASPRLISILDQEDQVAARAAGQPEAVVRNWMYANSIHLIDYFRLFGRGEIVDVSHVVPWTPERPGFVVTGLRFSSGDVGLYQAVWDGPGPWSVTVTTGQVRLEMRPLERLGIQRRGDRRLAEQPADPVDTAFKPGLRYQAEQLIKVLEGKPPALATLADAAYSMALCADIYGYGSSNAA